MVLELPRDSFSRPSLATPGRELDGDDIDFPVDGFDPVRAFSTVSQERLMVELITTLRDSLRRMNHWHRRPSAQPEPDRHRWLVVRGAGSPTL